MTGDGVPCDCADCQHREREPLGARPQVDEVIDALLLECHLASVTAQWERRAVKSWRDLTYRPEPVLYIRSDDRTVWTWAASAAVIVDDDEPQIADFLHIVKAHEQRCGGRAVVRLHAGVIAQCTKCLEMFQ
jgi:hypothetical protein